MKRFGVPRHPGIARAIEAVRHFHGLDEHKLLRATVPGVSFKKSAKFARIHEKMNNRKQLLLDRLRRAEDLSELADVVRLYQLAPDRDVDVWNDMVRKSHLRDDFVAFVGLSHRSPLTHLHRYLVTMSTPPFCTLSVRDGLRWICANRFLAAASYLIGTGQRRTMARNRSLNANGLNFLMECVDEDEDVNVEDSEESSGDENDEIMIIDL